ncbi:pilus assembly protein [Variovorax fucosicus]|uniref:pilus assembly protein n=1 Tax=Variovorax fucosicus TaxID=3053517 RepID=UPI002578AA8C|nr:PilC/PilY family type IV pilus protein [Variovorax sp. J22G47]MDM0054911.1 PilC/PilY family type IV pilus protein [Variovorax sp. J22G47]
MKTMFLKIVGTVLLLWCSVAGAQIQAVPPNISPDPNLPMVMLNVSKDFSMFSRAYTDYEDLNFDGAVDYTFMPAFKYYGYFDSTKCYTHDGNKFVPSTTGATVESGKYYCTADSYWSGNFLNWATMSRMDVLRKILYGGLRSTDSTTDTVLELSFVPRNSQAFVKFYNGTDLNRLTPFNYSDGLTLCRRHQNPTGDSASQTTTLLPVLRTARGNYLLWNMTEVKTCNWTQEISYTWKPATVTFMSNNYQGIGGTTVAHKSGTPDNPANSTSSKEYIARVQACVSSNIGDESCKQYGTVWKPRGLLNEFGESDNYGNKAAKAEFALMLGSFDSNLDGGVLRKNMSEINDEIDSSTGQFKYLSGGTAGIIQALSKLRLYGYNPNNGNYSESCNSRAITNGHCPSWGNPIGEIVTEGLRYFAGKTRYFNPGTSMDDEFGLPKPSWTDPLVSNPTYTSGKTRAALYGKNVCRPLNMVTISSGVSTFDDDQVNGAFTDIGGNGVAAQLTRDIGTQENLYGSVRLIGNNNGVNTPGDLCTGKTISDLSVLTGLCPEAPNMKGTYLGAGAAYWAHINQIRTDLNPLPANANAEALKVRQYAVSMAGGSASIQIPVPGTSPTKYVYITPASLDASISTSNPLAGNMVDFKVLNRAADGSSGSFVVLWQHYTLGEDQDQDMLGSIRYETDTSTSPPTLRVYTQTLESDTGSSAPYAFGYTLVGTQRDGSHFHSGINNYVSTESPAPTYSASSVQAAPRNALDKCYLNDDGSTPNGWDYTKAPRLCVKVGTAFVKGETMLSYQMVGSLDAVIRDPLWYMAKYGGFKDSKIPTLKPDAISKWDTKRADGALCGGASQPACADGIPDNYFLARRPDLLEDSLRQVFADITANSNSAPAVSRPDLRNGDYKYVATFSPQDLHGELTAYKLDNSGNFETSPSALGHVNLTNTANASRRIITNLDAVTGTAFTTTSIASTPAGSAGAVYRTALETSTTRQDALINYLRGDRTNEAAGLQFRVRNATSVMGGVINSNPWLQDRPSANYFGANFPDYGTFKTAQKQRDKLIWVGAADGMLHGFTSDTLTPVMSYVPRPLVSRLKDVANATVTDVNAYMDGSPFTGDVMLSTAGTSWKSYLFSSLGRGGKGIFALDVTADTDSTSNRLSEGNAASIFKWQFTSADDADLGYVLSEGGIHPITNQASQIAKMPNGKFAVLFGNGYGSTATNTNGKAVLYILFVNGPGTTGVWTEGTHYRKLVVDTGTGNGLMQPTWIDTNDDGIADTIYAGDLKGQMWKFDVSSTDPAAWSVAYGGVPLYAAKDGATVPAALPITAAPAVRFHPQGGQVVVFGTGKSVLSGDFPDVSRSQRVFGIWDKPYAAASALPTGLSELQQRSWSFDSTTGAIVQTNTTAINWATKKGWYLDIPLSSGMVLGNLLYSAVSKDIGIPLVYKKATTGAVCNDNAEGAYVQINAVTGLATANIFGVTSSTAGIVLGLTGLDQRFRVTEDSTSRCTTGLNCQRILGQNTDVNTKQNSTQSRIFWREIPGLKTAN